MKYVEMSNRLHAEHFKNELVDAQRIRIATSWFDDTTADFWRHDRMYECAECLAEDLNARWLTVGDGRWGLDSIRLKKKGFTNVLATDISEHLLKESKARGYIDDYAIENAEALSFADKSFDFVLCKESYHHFPRPFLALYEMLRVAQKGVFLIEPNDQFPSEERVRAYVDDLNANRKACFPQLDKDEYEGCGNYVYTISRRDMLKVALGLNLPQLAFKGLNDHYVKGCEF